MYYKEDWPKAKERLEAFWQHEMADRALMGILAPRRISKIEKFPHLTSGPWLEGLEKFKDEDTELIRAWWTDPEQNYNRMKNWFENTCFVGEAVPSTYINWGASAGCSFWGAEPHFGKTSVWFSKHIEDWATANPIIYRSGLAFQAVNSKWSRVKVTLIAGGIASVIGIFPGLSMKFLSVAALYGLILMPMGAVIFADHFLIKRLGMTDFFAEKRGITFYLPPALAWILTLAFCLLLNLKYGMQVFFLGLPGWFIAIAIYLGMSFYYQKRKLQN